MARETIGLSEGLRSYLTEQNTTHESDIDARLRERTAQLPMAEMQISAEQGRFLAWLVASLQARRAIEVGVFTGYSALCVARALPPDGQLIACDVSPEWTSIGVPFWEEAGVRDRIDLRIAPAQETLQQLLADGQQSSFDFVFLDADKESQPVYTDLALELLRVGGVLAIDNAFLGGDVLEPGESSSAQATRSVTERLFQDPAFDASLIPVGDGLLFGRKR